MMVLSVLRPDASLPEFLAHRAKSASIRRLAIDLIIGLAGFSAALRWRPSAWLVLASLALCFFAYGGWGIADRARPATATRDNLLLRALTETFCTTMIAAGMLAVMSLLFSLWAIALGTWIS